MLERLHAVYSLRSQLAGFAARNAAKRIAGGAPKEPLQAAFDAMTKAADIGDYDTFLEADLAFHRTIAALADVPILVDLWLQLERQFREFAGWSHRTVFRDLETIAQAHTAQVETILSGDAIAAERAAHVDLDALWQMLTEQPATKDDEVDPVERVCGYVILNLHRTLTLTGVAKDVAYLSPSHLARLFRVGRNISFTNYVQGLRMRRAASLLADTDLSVQSIADRVGYGDTSRFTLHFRREFGTPPSDWRREHVANARIRTVE